MKRFLAFFAAIALVTCACAKDLYVNATSGDDAADGLTPATARKTLTSILQKAMEGDVVHAAAGVYDQGSEVNTTDSKTGEPTSCYRAIVPAGVALIGAGADVTTIKGASDPDTTTGRGPKAIQCVYLKGKGTEKGAFLKGFTITGGRSFGKQLWSNNGGGVSCASNESVIDTCVIDDNVGNRGGGLSYGRYFNCFIGAKNQAEYTANAGVDASLFVNCVFGNSAFYAQNAATVVFVNCTLMGDSAPWANGTEKRLIFRNCITYMTMAVANGRLFNSYITKAFDPQATDPASGERLYDDACRSVSKEDLSLDDKGVPGAGSVAIDAGDYTHYDDVLPKDFWAYSLMDVELAENGVSRVMNANHLDIGAAEYDWRPVYARDLAPTRLTVAAVTPEVFETKAETVGLPAGAEMTVEWALPTSASGAIPFTFHAEVPANAALHVWRGEEEVLTLGPGSADAKFLAANVQVLRFVAEGAGDIVLSKFRNSTTLTIIDSDGGISVDGAKIGTSDILPGQSLRLIIQRNYQSRLTCAGVLIDDEFFSFTGEDADQVLDRRFEAREEPYTITAVYPAYNDWYVDAVNGDDLLNDGRVRYRPLRTLAAAMQNSLLASGDVVHAAPGLYDEGLDKVSASATTNRVCVRAGVTLVSDKGPLETIIEGHHHDQKTFNGPTAVRCCYMLANSVLKGFTLRHGATTQDSGKTAYGDVGGGITGSGSLVAVDCIITNCYAIRGGGASGGTYLRCRFASNSVKAYQSGASMTGPNLFKANCYNCRFTGTSAYIGQNSEVAVNCTFEDEPPTGIHNKGATTWQTVYNSIVLSAGENLQFKRCVFKSPRNGNTTADETCIFNVTNVYEQLDADRRPLTDSLLKDAGYTVYYTNLFPKAWLEEMNYDIAGGQRIYNDAIDIGCGEFDWRDDYRAVLAPHYLTVEEASPRVVRGAQALVLQGDSSLVLNWNIPARDDCCSFRTARNGVGTLTVVADGKEIQPDADGVYSFRTKAGGSLVRVTFEGEGTVALSSFKGARIGFQVQLF